MIEIDLLACPECGGRLVESDDAAKCTACGKRYAIVDGVLDFLTPPSHESGRDAER